MPIDEILKSLSFSQKELSSRIFDLALSKSLRKAYADFDQNTKDDMDRIFISGDDNEKEKFIKKSIPNLTKLLEQEMELIEQDIKAGIEKKMQSI